RVRLGGRGLLVAPRQAQPGDLGPQRRQCESERLALLQHGDARHRQPLLAERRLREHSMRVAITCAVILCAAVFHARADEAPVFSQLTFDDTITRTTVSADGHAVTAWVSSTVNGSP